MLQFPAPIGAAFALKYIKAVAQKSASAFFGVPSFFDRFSFADL